MTEKDKSLYIKDLFFLCTQTYANTKTHKKRAYTLFALGVAYVCYCWERKKALYTPRALRVSSTRLHMTLLNSAGADRSPYPTRPAPRASPNWSLSIDAPPRRLASIMGLTRKERRAFRFTQLQLSLLNRRKKRVAGGWVSLEIDSKIRQSIEQHMARSK